jgi:hypothetical protein
MDATLDDDDDDDRTSSNPQNEGDTWVDSQGEQDTLKLGSVNDFSFEKCFANTISSSSFSEYLAPAWNEEHECGNTQQHADDETGYVIYDDKSQSFISITELVTYELESYVNMYTSAFVDSFRAYLNSQDADPHSLSSDFEPVTSQLQTLISEAIRADAIKNSQYCKKLVKWLSTKHRSSLRSEECSPSSRQSGGELASSSGQELSNQISRVNEVCDEYMKFAPGPWRECTLLEAFKGVPVMRGVWCMVYDYNV